MPVPYFPRVMSNVVIDLSHWQEDVDFNAAAGDGVQAVILKCSQGSNYADPTYLERVEAAEMAGMLVGAYHFLDDSDPISQVDHFIESADGATTVLVLDIEEYIDEAGADHTVSIAQAAEAADEIFVRTGRWPLIYMGRWGVDGAGGGLPNETLSQCPLWLPQYGTSPVLPAGWDHWLFWQHSDGEAGLCRDIPGIGPCDQTVFAGTPDEMIDWWRHGIRPAKLA